MKPLVMITGAGNRIGAATARAFHNAGHPLLLLAHRFDALAALELSHTLCVSADLRDHAAVDAAIDRGVAAYGPVDCLVNNAGEPAPGGAHKPMADSHHEAVENCMHALIPAMKARRRGTIVNIQPIAGRRARAAQAAGGNAPRFLDGLSDATRCSLAEHDVRVVVVSPSLADEEPAGSSAAPANGNTGRPAALWPGEHSLEGGLAAEHVARTVLFAYQMPQDVILQELTLTPTRHTF